MPNFFTAVLSLTLAEPTQVRLLEESVKTVEASTPLPDSSVVTLAKLASSPTVVIVLVVVSVFLSVYSEVLPTAVGSVTEPPEAM